MSRINSQHDLGGFDAVPEIPPSVRGRSKYCYLFKDLPTLPNVGLFGDLGPSDAEQVTVQRLLDFSKWISNKNPLSNEEDLTLRIDLPAAHTYFGQFVNHDMSAPLGGVLAAPNNINEAVIIGDQQLDGVANLSRAAAADILDTFSNEHANPMMLMSLYGEGAFPADDRQPSPEIRSLYDDEGLCFRLGVACDARDKMNLPAGVIRLPNAPDILRELNTSKDPAALIADRRNDENLILSQLHLAMMLLHNKAVRALRAEFPNPAECFAQARRLVTHHYHWCILHDFLPALLSTKVDLAQVIALPNNLPKPELPLEFTTAAFRFGHSMVSNSYDYNANFGAERQISSKASLLQLFNFTTHAKMDKLGPHSPLPDHWVIDWDRMTAPAGSPRSRGERIDLVFSPKMMNAVPGQMAGLGSIVARNLVRGFHRRIAFGQQLSKACGIKAMTAKQIASVMPDKLNSNPLEPDANVAVTTARKRFLTETPAWLYFLCEAKFHHKGARLGPAASVIIAETFVGLMKHNKSSILSGPDAGWTPNASPLRRPDQQPIANLRDMLMFAVAS